MTKFLLTVGGFFSIAVLSVGGLALHGWTAYLFWHQWGRVEGVIALFLPIMSEVVAALACFGWGRWFYILAILSWLLNFWCLSLTATHAQENSRAFYAWLVSFLILLSLLGAFVYFATAFATAPRPITLATEEEGEASPPPLNAKELSVVSRVYAKGLRGKLTEADVDEFRTCVRGYSERTGRPPTRQEVEALREGLELSFRYNRELGSCLLLSVDLGGPVLTQDYERLRKAMLAASGARQSKLDADKALIIATAKGEPSVNEFGETIPVLTREEILASLKSLDIVEKNLDTLSRVFSEYVDE